MMITLLSKKAALTGKSTKARDNHNEDRYVTTAPSYDAKLRPNDKV